MDGASVFALLAWWVVFLALGAVGLPIAATVFSSLPDRGAGLAIPTAIVVLILPIYWLGHLAFTGAVIAVGVLFLVGVSVALLRRNPKVDRHRAREAAIVFTIGFGLVVAIRAVDPSIMPAGGEKFLDFGLLNAVLRTDVLPPEDIWFAGEPVQYYYGGHLVAGVLTELTMTQARHAYNLALAGFYGSLVTAAYGLAGSIAASHGHRFRTAGGLGAVFVGLASNLVPPLQVLVTALPAGLESAVSGWIASRTALEAGRVTAFDTLTYWTASRVISGTINEFPLFAWLNGDLHAHMMSTPFLLLAAGIALAYFYTRGDALRTRRWLAFGALPPVAGLVAVVNTWSFPSTIGVLWLSILFATSDPADLLPVDLGRLGDPDGWSAEVRRVGSATVAAAVAAFLAIGWVLPFFVGPATGASGRSLGMFPERSGLLEFVLVYGWLLLVFALFLAQRSERTFESDRARLVVMAGLFLGIAVLMDAAAIGLVLPIMAIGWVLLRRGSDVGFETVLIIGGAGLVLIVEFLFVQEQAGPGRLNTVFKTYMQVWVLWATAAGAAIVRIRPVGRPDLQPDRAARVLVAILLVSVTVYGAVTLGIHFGRADSTTLDATTWAASTHSAEWEAIRWLDGKAGQPNIVTAPGCWCNPVESTLPYRWVNAPSSFTGIPTLAGWSHEVGYRGQAPYDTRVADVRTIYSGTVTERERLLADYDVEYIYVGPNERALYGDVSFAELDGVTVVFENTEVTIYAVS